MASSANNPPASRLLSRVDRLPRWLGRETWPGWLAGLVLFVLYMVTLQRIISGPDGPHMFDAGEMQVALNLWGLPHAPSYPLYVLLGAPLVWLQKLVGVSPATAVSAVSLLWSLLALAVLYDLLRRRTRQPWLAGAALLLIGVIESVWLHSVIGEVYSLMLLFVALILWWVLHDVDAPWTRRRWLVLAALLGFGVGHHRAVAFLVPGLAIYLWPHFWKARREMPLTLLLGTLLFLAGFLPYLYIPLYARVDGRWFFGDPTTLDGLWTIITAKDWNYIVDPPVDLADLGTHVAYVTGVIARQLTWPGLVVVLAAPVSLLFLKGYPRRMAWLWMALTATFLGLALWVPDIVIDYPEPSGGLPMLVLPVLALAEVLAYLANAARRQVFLTMSGGLLGLWAAFLIFQNFPFIYAATHDPNGVNYEAHLATLEPVAEDTYFYATPWGPEYMAMAYGLYVTGELGGFQPVDHNADFQAILKRGDRLVTTPDMLYVYPREWWLDRLGGEMHLRSAGPGFVEIDDSPLPGMLGTHPVRLANGVTLVDSQIQSQGEGRYALTLYWQANGPLETDYSVYVHLTSADPPTGPDDILAQADSSAPVSGWYPVTLWQPGEVVRDEYLVVAPEGYQGPLYLRVGMYRQLDDGSFENLDALSQPLTS